jgi:hypothetical protein
VSGKFENPDGSKELPLLSGSLKADHEGGFEPWGTSLRFSISCSVLFRDRPSGNRLAAATIAAICRQRRQIELFFKWIKQNLKIETFLGASKNAVMAQIRTAMIYNRLLSRIKFMTPGPIGARQSWLGGSKTGG